MPADSTASASWDSISQRLREMLNAGIYSTWFSQVHALEQDSERLVVGVPNEFTKTWIEGHFGSLLDAAASEDELVVELRVAVAEAVAATRTGSPASRPRPTSSPPGCRRTQPRSSRPARASTRATRSTSS